MRLLKANEIESRISTVRQNGLSLLLYKDARVDMKMLDEEYGAFNWQKSYEIVDGRLYCVLSVWDSNKGQWISKMDVGTESYTEKEKGQASDAFKRAGFCWGVGRELYTAPFIWIPAELCDIRANDGGKYVCYDKFKVVSVEYNEDREISGLVIANAKTGDVVYEFPRKGQPAARKIRVKREYKKAPSEDAEVLDEKSIEAVRTRLKAAAEKGKVLEESDLCKSLGIDKLEDMNVGVYKTFNRLMAKAGV